MCKTRPRIPLLFRSGEWRLPCGCAFHYWDGVPELGVIQPHVHPCEKHRKEYGV